MSKHKYSMYEVVGIAVCALLAFNALLSLMILLAVVIKRYIRRHVEFISYDKEWDPAGKLVVITGASSGMGAELAKQYAKRGANLALCARRSEELQSVRETCLDLNPRINVKIFVADVSDVHDCKKFIEFAGGNEGDGNKSGVIDCLILNAGISMGQDFSTLTDTSILRKLMDVNYFGAVNCLFYAQPYLKRSIRPKVVVLSSAAGIFGAPTRTGYCASKFALHGFFEAWRCEAAPKIGVEVTIVCPGVVQTDINRTRLSSGNVNPGVLDTSHGMSASQAAQIIYKSVARGDRECLMTPEQAPGRLVKIMFPEIVDWFVSRKIRKLQSFPPQKTVEDIFSVRAKKEEKIQKGTSSLPDVKDEGQTRDVKTSQ